MASEFYQITGGDEVLLVGPGQAHCRKLDITTAVNLRVGFFISFCKMTAKDTAYTGSATDNVSITTGGRNLGFMLGVRKYSTALLGSAGEYFAGLSGVGSPLTLQNSGGNNFNTGATLKPGVFDGTASDFGPIEVWNVTPASGVYASFIGLKFWTNTGNARIGFQNYGAVTDLSAANLQYRLANFTDTWGTTVLSGRADAITNSDSIYIQNPFVYSGIRIHAYGFMVEA